jgi:hypothetical protein
LQGICRCEEISFDANEVLDIGFVGEMDIVLIAPIQHLANKLKPSGKTSTNREASANEDHAVSSYNFA